MHEKSYDFQESNKQNMQIRSNLGIYQIWPISFLIIHAISCMIKSNIVSEMNLPSCNIKTKFLIYVKLVLISDTYCILIYCYVPLLPFKKLVLVLKLSKAWRNSQSKAV